jgi:hypothetical protein
LGWRATQAADNDGGRRRELAGLVTADLAKYQLISKVKPAVTSTGPTLLLALISWDEQF